MGGALQEHRLTHNLAQIFGLEHRRWHAREGRELVDHAADVADMADDRVGADREGFDVAFDLLQISAAQPFRRQLDRGQRVLDFVRDAAGDIGPGRLTLRRQQFGNVVERNDEAADFAAIMLRRDADEQSAGAGPADELHLRLGEPLRTAPSLVQQAGHFRRDQGETLPD